MTMLVSILILFAVVALLWRGLSADEGQTDKRKKNTNTMHWPMRRVIPETMVEFAEETAPGRGRKRESPHQTEASRELTPARRGGSRPSLASIARRGKLQDAEASDELVRRGEEAAVAVRALSEGGEERGGWQAAYSDAEPFNLRRAETAADSALQDDDSISAADAGIGGKRRRLDAEFSLELTGSAEDPRAARGAYAASNASSRQETFELRAMETQTESAAEWTPASGGKDAGAGEETAH